MEIWMLFAALLFLSVMASALPARTPPPQPIIVLQAFEQPTQPTGSGCLPLIVVVVVIALAMALL
jgi:hypothetical protein